MGWPGWSWSRRKAHQGADTETRTLESAQLVWAMGSLCALHRMPFDPALLLRQFSPPYDTSTLVHAARALGFRIRRQQLAVGAFGKAPMPVLAVLNPPQTAIGNDGAEDRSCAVEPALLVLVTSVTPTHIRYFEISTAQPIESPISDFADKYQGSLFFIAKAGEAMRAPVGGSEDESDDGHNGGRDSRHKGKPARFGFRWFIPVLCKHTRVAKEILFASLVIQLLALGTPLFTQAIIDKVVVHRTESTLLVIAIGMAMFMLFSALLSWVRQYLVVHTGNRIDAVLADSVFEHLFKLPARYFAQRPTGVIAARLQSTETIREFIASAAVTLILDLPFLLIFVAIMFWYSVPLTLIALAVLGSIAVLSIAVAPLFRELLNQQFLLGARNQAFLTEHIAGLETVKSLQMEPQLRQRFSGYLADYLHAGFKTRQLANTYNTIAGVLEQVLSLGVLVAGAWMVMKDSQFTIGMLVAFQMFAGRLSQPMMRLVGLWQQFQQARLSVLRLGDVMDAPTEPYSVIPSRLRSEAGGLIEIDGLCFRHSEKHPWLFQNFCLRVMPGSVIAIMGTSGCGKSTLAKLLQGFYQPSSGSLRVDGMETGNLPANELRQYFGVVPQETVLFSGTLYDNLLVANPHASFESIARACQMAEIHDVIEALPDGYQTEVGERGAGLSGGQRQRIAIARALLKGPAILIFDEAISALDQATARQFAATLNRLKGQLTVLFITHAVPDNLLVDQVIHLGVSNGTDSAATGSPLAASRSGMQKQSSKAEDFSSISEQMVPVTPLSDADARRKGMP